MPRMTYSGTSGATVTYGITNADDTVDTAPTSEGVTAAIVGTPRTKYTVDVPAEKFNVGKTIDWYEGGQVIDSDPLVDVLTSIDALPDEIDAALSAAHGSGSWGETVEGDTLLTHETRIDASGNIVTDGSGTALGRIVDSSGIPVPGATLTLYAASDLTRSTPLRRATAAVDGTWSLPAPSGSLVLVVSKDGFYDAADGDATIDVAITVE